MIGNTINSPYCWKRVCPTLLAILSGIMIALSFPQPGISPMAWIALIPLLIAMEGQNPVSAFRTGMLTGFVAYSALLYWVTIVMTSYGKLPWFASIPLWLMLAAWLSLFTGAAAMVTAIGERHGIKSALTLPVVWVSADYLRGIILTGFPWTMLGHSQYRFLPLIQIADIAGVYGITALIVLANIVFYRIVRALSGTNVPYPAKSAIILFISSSAVFWYGFHKLNIPPQNSSPVRVALIQGNIDQSIKWSPEFQQSTIDIYSSLSRQAISKAKADLVVWPESAAPFFFQEDSPASRQIVSLARELDTWMLFGSPATEQREKRTVYLNSAFLLDKSGKTVGRTDKIHLVPFGEYVPLAPMLPFVNKLVHGIGDFAPGREIKPLMAGDTPLGVLVCYEAIFPDISRRHVNSGSRILVNITNDAWFGRSSAPYQHLSMAAFRAVETRTPLIRAANTGITSLVDQNGHIKGMTRLFNESVLIGEVQPGTADAPYLRIGDLFAQCCLSLTVLIIFIQWKRRIPKA